MSKAGKKAWKPDPDYKPRDHYQEVTDKIIAALEAGTVPWRKPWDSEKVGGPQAPINPTTGKRYRGVNTLLLGMDFKAFTTSDPRWCTFAQAKDKGWSVRKGEKSTTIFFYKKLEVKDRDAKGDPGEDGKKFIPLLKAYSVFHASQIDGIPAYVSPDTTAAPWRRPEAADIIIKNSGAVIRTGGDRAFYSPGTDHIQLPPDKAFASPEYWASTALHELGYWTGHKDRLNRDLTGRFGSGAYAQEELRAELASVFVGAEVGIPADVPQHATYIASWLHALKNDKRELFHAASDAQRMADHCLAFHPEWKASRDAEAKAEAAAEAGIEDEAALTPEAVLRPVAAVADTVAAVAERVPSAPRPAPLRPTAPAPDFANALTGHQEDAPAPSYYGRSM